MCEKDPSEHTQGANNCDDISMYKQVNEYPDYGKNKAANGKYAQL